MDILETILWLLALLLVAAGIAVAVIATRAGRHWLAAPVIGLVAVLLLANAAQLQPPHPAIALALGVGCAALGVIGGSPVVSLVLSLATRGSVRLGAHGGILVPDADSPLPQREILRGGATIGYLERIAVMGSVLVGQPAGIAVIVAIKGLGRYSELETPAARERFLIGTLTSLVWAGAATGAVTLSW